MQKIFYTLPGTEKEIAVYLDHADVWVDRKMIPELLGCSIEELDRAELEYASSEEWQLKNHNTFLAPEDGNAGPDLRDPVGKEFVLSLGFLMQKQAGLMFYHWARDTHHRFIQNADSSPGRHSASTPATQDVAHLIESYLPCFILLNQYDSHRLPIGGAASPIRNELVHSRALSAISALKERLVGRNEATTLFGHEKDESFQSTLQSIAQTFGGQYLYPGIGEQAAHLLYSVIKNHSFSDGNKRIGAFLFTWFLEINQYLRRPDGSLKMDAMALTALALLVAQSRPDDREDILKLIESLIL